MFTIITLATLLVLALIGYQVITRKYPNAVDAAQADAIRVETAIRAELHMANRQSNAPSAPVVLDAANRS